MGDEDTLYLVMEYVEGEPLSELIKAARRRGVLLPLSIVLRIVSDALAGLHAAHDTRGTDRHPLGVVHRDVSPQNILVGVGAVGTHCLAEPGREYLAYKGGAGNVTLRIAGAVGNLAATWINLTTNARMFLTDQANGSRAFTNPWSGPAMLYLVAR